MSATIIDMNSDDNAVKVNLLQCIHALNLEHLTGMKSTSRGSVLKHAQTTYGIASKDKKGAVKELVAKLKELDPEYTPGPSIAKTLNS